jgi:hypothetical protein
MDKALLEKCWNDAQNSVSPTFVSSNRTFDDWYRDNTIPKDIEDAIKYCSQCDSDMGFMGSPKYYELKETINNYFEKKKIK